MGHADEAPLLPDRQDGLGAGEARRHRLAQEQPDQVTVAGLDLLADEDREARPIAIRRDGLSVSLERPITSLQGAVDPLVVGDREVRQAAGRGGADDGGGRRQRIEARGRVAVEVDEDARGPRARRRRRGGRRAT
jgi:hypothetical protein